MNSIFDEGSIIKQINKYKLKFISKLVITLSAQKSIIAKKNLLNRFINAKIHKLKTLLIGTIKIPKTRYLLFQANTNNIKNTWKGIKSNITIKY